MDTSTSSQQVAQATLSLIHKKIGQGSAPNNFLLIGKLGLVLYYFSLYEAGEDETNADKCIELLEEVMNEEDEQLPPLYGTGFASGTAGLGYILSLLQKAGLLDMDLQEELEEMDTIIAATALKEIEEDDHIDYLHGAMGAIHYFLMRAGEPVIKKYLEQLAAALCRKVVHTQDGSWFRNYIIDRSEKERIDLSLSHGNSGFLLLLINMLEAGIMEQEVKELITNGVRFIINQRMPNDSGEKGYSLYPFYINSIDHKNKYANERLAWCYGDLNIAWLLYRASSILQVQEWKELADEIVDDTLPRKDAVSTMATDSHFCHGTAGLAFFYQVIYSHTKNEKCKAAAEYWICETIRYLDIELKNDFYKDKETDLLNGLPGINLVLLSYITKKELAWGRAFLL